MSKKNKFKFQLHKKQSIKPTQNSEKPAIIATNSSVIDTEFNNSSATASDEMTEINSLSATASAEMTEADLKAIETLPPPAPDITVVNLIAKGHEAVELLNIQKKRLQEMEEQLREKTATVEIERAELQSERDLLEQLKTDLNTQRTELDTRQESLLSQEQEQLKREEKLIKREIDADAGFSQRNRESLERLEQEAKSLRDELSKHRMRILSEREEWEKELHKSKKTFQTEMDRRTKENYEEAQKDREKLQSEFDQKDIDFKAYKDDLKAEAARLRKEAKSIQVDRELLEEDRQAFDDRVKQHAAAKLEKQDAQIKALEERLEAARQERDDLGRQLAQHEAAEQQFDGQRPEDVLNELRKLRAERDTLKKEMEQRPSAEAFQHLQELERQRGDWEVDRMKFLAEVSELKQDVIHKRIAVTELESLRNHKAALEAGNALLTKALEDEIQKVNDLVRGADGASPFPSCSKMDLNNDFQITRPTSDEIPNLKEFAEYVRHRMAHDPKTGKILYYSPEDVRSFLAGLAMSRLHLLQGISGTGKTSLPIAFARAIGAGNALIEVQAGWRDRQDLIGHFNTFEKRFHETEFLQALYKASCPVYRHTPFIIVLDEMNLSHPEQYFADLLSTLEQEQSRQRLVLMDAAVEPAPALLTEGGRMLPIPPNVWFVGTANHDETTKVFADKTFDRAHVMELPRQKTEFKIVEQQPRLPISTQALSDAFLKAKNKYSEDAEKVWDFLKGSCADLLDRRFRVGWGNRLQRQMENYIPVVLDCGGSIGEATDHVLATKLLRKIRDRQDNRPEDIISLRDQVRAEWTRLDTSYPPRKSLAILDEELHRLGHGED